MPDEIDDLPHNTVQTDAVESHQRRQDREISPLPEEPSVLVPDERILDFWAEQRDYGFNDPVARLDDEINEDSIGFTWLDWHAPHRYDLDDL